MPHRATKGASLVEIARRRGHATWRRHVSDSQVQGLVERLGEDLFEGAPR